MRTVSRSRVEVIRLAHPNARVTQRNGKEVILIPTYDIDTDTAGEIALAITDDPPDRKPQPGDIMRDPRTGAEFQIMDPAALIPVRKGPKAEFGD